MLFVVRFSPEIIIKSRDVRHRNIRVLRRSLRMQSARIHPDIVVRGDWDSLEVAVPDSEASVQEQVIQLLERTPGIALFLLVRKLPLPDLDGVAEHTLTHYATLLPGRRFAVRCKRTGSHPWNSLDVERHVGRHLLQHCPTARVDLGAPEIVVKVEIHHDELFVVERSFKGLGGYPLGTQDDVLSLISGGFDSSVASFLTMRRGLVTHFCCFRLGGRDHELAVKDVALYLWMRYGASHRVKFVTVPFEAVVDELAARLEPGLRGVILKRMMLRAATRVADQLRIPALVTGECVAQVASQTLANLAVIDQVTDKVLLRPLIVTDKQDIIDIARRIGTEEFSRHVPEFCGAVSQKPTTRACPQRIAEQEALFDFSILDAAVQDAQIQMIDRVMESFGAPAPQVRSECAAIQATLIDIRHPLERDTQALPEPLRGLPLLRIPFYELPTRLATLSPAEHYVLYCAKGVMSRLHAAHMQAAGFTRVSVFGAQAQADDEASATPAASASERP